MCHVIRVMTDYFWWVPFLRRADVPGFYACDMEFDGFRGWHIAEGLVT